MAYALLEAENREQYSDATIEIVKTKISEMLFNETLDHDDKLIGGLVCNFFAEGEDSGVGIYSVKVMRIHKHFKNSMQEYIIRDIKFDKAEAILWSPSMQKQKQAELD